MPKQTKLRALLYYLRRYLDAEPKRAKTFRTYCRRTHGAEIDRSTFWRHVTLRVEPPGSLLLVYLGFLYREKAIIRPAARHDRQMFVYAFPELLRAKK